MSKKILAALLAVMMVLSLVPMTAFAADGEPTGTGTETDPYIISQSSLTTSQDESSTLMAFSKTGYYKLSEDIETDCILASGPMTGKGPVILDLAGHTLNQKTAGVMFFLDNDLPNLEIKNSGTTGKISLLGSGSDRNSTIQIGYNDSATNNITLTIGKGVELDASAAKESDLGFTIMISGAAQNATLNLTGCTIKAHNGVTINGNNITGESKINLSGATIIADGYGIYQAGSGNTIDVGDASDVEGGLTGIEIRAGKLILDNSKVIGGDGQLGVTANPDGTTTVNAAVAVAQHTTKQPIDVQLKENVKLQGGTALSIKNPQDNPDKESVKVKIEGGTYEGEVKVDSDTTAPRTLVVTGGTFNDASAKPYLDAGLGLVERNGKQVVTLKEAEVIENSTYTIDMAKGNTADAIKPELTKLVNKVLSDAGFTKEVTVDDIAVADDYVAATAGGAREPDGRPGSFNFKVTLTKATASAPAVVAEVTGKGVVTPTAFKYTVTLDSQTTGGKLTATVTPKATESVPSPTPAPLPADGKVNKGDTVTVTIEPDAGYSFKTLKVDGAAETEGITDGEDGKKTYTHTVNKSVTISAEFEANELTLDITATPPAGTTETGDIRVKVGNAAEIPYTSGTTEVKAHVKDEVVITVTPPTVTPAPTTPPTAPTTYKAQFSGVTDGVNGDNTYTFTMPAANATVALKYVDAAKTHNITIVNNDELGSVVANEWAVEGEYVTVTARPIPGYKVDKMEVVTADGESLQVTPGDDENSGTFRMYDIDVTVTVSYTERSDYKVTVAGGKDTDGTTDIALADAVTLTGLSNGDNPSKKFGENVSFKVAPKAEGKDVVVTIKDAEGNEITPEVAEDGTYSFTMPASNVTITVGLKLKGYTVTVTEPANGTLTAKTTIGTDLPESVENGTNIVVKATPKEGYQLDTLTVTIGGKPQQIAAGATEWTGAVTADTTVSATFKAIDYTVTATLNGAASEKVKVDKATAAHVGDTITVTVELGAGEVLGNVTATYDEDKSVDVTVTGNVATFALALRFYRGL